MKHHPKNRKHPRRAGACNRSRVLQAVVLSGLCLCLAVALDQGAARQSGGAESDRVIASAPRDFDIPAREVAVGGRITSDRAFLGAPPFMPHRIRTERSSKYCLECHAVKTRLARRHRAIVPLPHPEYSQCSQCHVSGDPAEVAPFRENDFVGLDFPGKGSRAHDYAPPTVPHKVFMRENCLACHGPTGIASVRTTHPERSQCLQCHVTEASQNYDRPLEWSRLSGMALSTP